MERIELRKNWKALGVVFAVMLAFIGFLVWKKFGGGAESPELLTLVALAAAIVVTVVIGVLVYIYQPDLVLEQRGIRIEGRSEVVPYQEIDEVKVGLGAMSINISERIYTLSNIYTNYSEAAEFLKAKVFGRIKLSVTDRRRNEIIFLLVALGIVFYLLYN